MPAVCGIDLQLIMKTKCGKELLKPGKNTVNPDNVGYWGAHSSYE
jgi:hypothetical protein